MSASCRAALIDLEHVEAGGDEDAAVVASMTACTTVDEYIAGVTENPASWLLTGPEFVDRDTILAAGCSIDDSTAVCEDARELGYID